VKWVEGKTVWYEAREKAERITKKGETMQYRHECKYQINAFDLVLLRQRLPLVMQRDVHSGEGAIYGIRSLYFDDAEDKALQEKLDGVSRREKYRIRMYNGDASFLRLEKKVKIGNLGTKISAPVTREDVEKILKGDISWMEDDQREPVRDLYIKMKYGGLRPKTIVAYDREPFVYGPGNVRVTLDTNIRSGIYSTDFFGESVPLLSAAPEAFILEVKYDNFLPEVIADLVQLGNREVGSFSKYAACRSFTYE